MKTLPLQGDLVTFPANTKIWCIDLQSTIQFDENLICKVSRTLAGKRSVFLKRKTLRFNLPEFDSALKDAAGDFGPVAIDHLEPYVSLHTQELTLTHS